jgi:hypothetical protein
LMSGFAPPFFARLSLMFDVIKGATVPTHPK